MACLIILCRSRVDHPRVAIRSVVWRQSSFLFYKSGCTVLYLFKIFNLGSGVWIPFQVDSYSSFGQTSML